MARYVDPNAQICIPQHILFHLKLIAKNEYANILKDIGICLQECARIS